MNKVILGRGGQDLAAQPKASVLSRAGVLGSDGSFGSYDSVSVGLTWSVSDG
jgi:hypothetical protein